MEDEIKKMIEEEWNNCGDGLNINRLAKRITDSIVIDESILTVILMSFKDCDNWEELAKAIAKAKPFKIGE